MGENLLGEKITFYNFEAFNAQLTRKNFLLISLTSVPGALFNIFLIIILTLGLVAELNQIL
jgi:hypothetical protein